MATILFVMKYPLDGQENLKTKYDGQMSAVCALGHEAYCIGWDQAGTWLCGADGSRSLLRRCSLTGMPGYGHTKIFIDLMAAVREVLSKKKVDVLYLRYMPTLFGAEQAMRRLKAQGGKLVVEHPTYPPSSGVRRGGLRKPVFWFADRVMARIHPMVDLYTLIGDPCGTTLDGRPAMNIVNGVDVERMPPHKPREKDAPIELLALASMSFWQGYDRILEAMSREGGGSSLKLHMVGGEGDGSLARWKKMTAELGLDGRVQFHGPLYGEALDKVADRCDIGLGGLGLFRNKQMLTMTLKLREYMARGLPFVYAVDDPAIESGADFCLRVPNDETPIDMNELMAFARAARSHPEWTDEMRDYARRHMSWTAVMQSVLERVLA